MMSSWFSENMELAEALKAEQTSTSSRSLAMSRSQPPFHLLEKLANLLNRQAIAGQQGVQDWVIEQVIERRLRFSVCHR
jgi:hypothetical protein